MQQLPCQDMSMTFHGKWILHKRKLAWRRTNSQRAFDTQVSHHLDQRRKEAIRRALSIFYKRGYHRVYAIIRGKVQFSFGGFFFFFVAA